MEPLGLTDEACKGRDPGLLCTCSFLPALLQIFPPSQSTFDAPHLTSLTYVISTAMWGFLNLTNVQHLAREKKKHPQTPICVSKNPQGSAYPRMRETVLRNQNLILGKSVF